MTDKFLTEKDIDYLEKRLRDTFITKDEFFKYKSELFEKLDEIIKNTRDSKEEVDLIENRVTKIESNLTL